MHLIKDRSDTIVGKRSRKQKNSCLRIKIPRSSKKDGILGLGHCSPTVAAEEELIKRVEVDLVMRLTIRPMIYPTNESLEQISEEEEEKFPRRRIKVMIPLPVSTHPIAAIQLRSAVQRRTPPRKLEGENPNGFRYRTASKPGSNCGATGFRGREGGA